MFITANREVLKHITLVHNFHLSLRVTGIHILILERNKDDPETYKCFLKALLLRPINHNGFVT